MAAPEIKVVIVAMFEPGAGQPGELTYFRAAFGLRPWSVPGLPAEAVWRNDEGVAALVAGVGPVNTAVNVLTLGLAAEADFRRAYWLVAGVAGGNPAACSLGSPVWADWVVDGDLAHDFHPADCPPTWETGILPLGAREPYVRASATGGEFGDPAQVFALNRGLAAWAHAQTRALPLFDSPELAAARAPFAALGTGGEPPAVRLGATLSSARFWNGARHQAWAEKWVAFWTRGQGAFFTSGMEDSGTLGALTRLGGLGRADPRRALVLRTVSNYTVPPPGALASAALLGEPGETKPVSFPGLSPALENGGRAGTAVVGALLTDWDRWRDSLPSEPPGW